jgi:L-fucose mutarotase/ribose pyranase (RbsD/FucU family)
MKKFLIGLMAFMMVFSIAGCGVRQKLENKAGEAIAEKILGAAGVDANIDGNQVVIKGEDGQEITFSDGKWPSSSLAENIPEFKGGKISSVMEAKDSLYIMIEDISDKDFTAYLEDIKKAFAEETYLLNTDTGVMYAAGNGKGISVMLTYEKDAGASITVTRSEK